MQNVISPQQLLHRSDAVLETQVDGEVVLMSMEAGNCYGLNLIGSEIWRMLVKPATLAELQCKCRGRYAGDPVTIDRDVSELLSTLMAEQLVEAL